MHLGKEKSKIHISGDGGRVIVETMNKKLEYKPFDHKGIENGSLQSKLKQWYLYAYNFVETLRKKQPKIVVQNFKLVTAPSAPNRESDQISMKINTVLTLSEHIDITMRHKIGQTDQSKEVIVRGKPSDCEHLELEYIIGGQKRTQ